MPKSPRKRSTKKIKGKKSKNRKRINDGTIVKPEDVILDIRPTKVQEFYQLYLGTSRKPFDTLDFSSLTIKIGEESKTFGSEGLPVSVKGEVVLKDGKHIYAFTLDNYYKTTYWKDIPFFEGKDVVDFVQKK
jgi:hypothetical protein